MRKFIFISSLFFLFEIIVHGLVPFLIAEDKFDPFTTVLHQAYDFVINTLLLFIFRARHWPEYFNLGILDAPLLGFGGQDGN
jgi:hypothetical protein